MCFVIEQSIKQLKTLTYCKAATKLFLFSVHRLHLFLSKFHYSIFPLFSDSTCILVYMRAFDNKPKDNMHFSHKRVMDDSVHEGWVATLMNFYMSWLNEQRNHVCTTSGSMTLQGGDNPTLYVAVINKYSRTSIISE